ncbi:MAG: hypothetical protein PHG27_04615 [Massilibacteroides sp.]|nr:hypothetical protein [Massilibacteroides sp.]MDD3063247.1 hypothetical protein [Massilibacteroides sp.]MDD4114868.1 hypothetical protein [Massilibacteroides sp.]MDD4659326.1 hypothetical protein [Massilibacteroides sp.]
MAEKQKKRHYLKWPFWNKKWDPDGIFAIKKPEKIRLEEKKISSRPF